MLGMRQIGPLHAARAHNDAICRITGLRVLIARTSNASNFLVWMRTRATEPIVSFIFASAKVMFSSGLSNWVFKNLSF